MKIQLMRMLKQLQDVGYLKLSLVQRTHACKHEHAHARLACILHNAWRRMYNLTDSVHHKSHKML